MTVRFGPVRPVPALLDLLSRVDRHPEDRPALMWPEGELSYGALRRERDRIRDRLADISAPTDGVVALEAARHPNYVAALLAVLGSGRPAMPVAAVTTQRDREMLARVRPAASVTLDGYVSALPMLPRGSCPPGTAVVLTTSGTTGVPKGVPVPAAGLANYLECYADAIELGPDDVVLHSSNPLFDAALEEVLAALVAGGTVYLEDFGRDLITAVNDWDRAGVSVLVMTTSLFAVATRSLIHRRLPLPSRLRVVVIGGEAYSTPHVEAWLRLETAPLLLNAYGPAEASVSVTFARLGQYADRLEGANLLGEPVANTGIYLLDATGAAVPAGTVGEIWIGGIGVAPCYLGVPDHPSFAADPFAPARTTMYRTGDRAFVDAAGLLRFVGRDDDQVKVRGHRIELGEIEVALSRLRDVSEVAVVVTGEGPDRTLTAFVRPAQPRVHGAQLRRQAAELMPRHLLPDRIIIHDEELPRTSRGKLDRKRLRAEVCSAGRVGTGTSPAITLLEDILARPVDPTSDFYAQGGSSLTAITWTTRLRTDVGIDLSPRVVLTAPSITEALQSARPMD